MRGRPGPSAGNCWLRDRSFLMLTRLATALRGLQKGRTPMAEIVRAALVQQRWTGDKESMIAAAVTHIQTAASAGAQVVCLQELFYGPYFCQVQDADYYSYTEAIPDGPTTVLMQDVAGP